MEERREKVSTASRKGKGAKNGREAHGRQMSWCTLWLLYRATLPRNPFRYPRISLYSAPNFMCSELSTLHCLFHTCNLLVTYKVHSISTVCNALFAPRPNSLLLRRIQCLLSLRILARTQAEIQCLPDCRLFQ
jgi:hypothetical protein